MVHFEIVVVWPAVVRDLVRGIAESGEWAETHRLDAAKLAAPYFWRTCLLRFVLTEPPGRVSYRMLTPSDKEILEIRDMALKAVILEKPIELKDFLDRSFIPTNIKSADITVPRDFGRD